MQSTLYRSILEEGEARGEARGQTLGEANSLLLFLTTRLGHVAPEVQSTILAKAQEDPKLISSWLSEAFKTTSRDAALRLVRKISAI